MKRILSFQSEKENIEIITALDNEERTIGQKRNDLLNAATGKYVCFVDDDDDMISPFYVSKILEAVQTEPDCIGIKGWIVLNRHHPREFIHSIEYTEWFEKNQVYYRNPNHLNPIKREIALSVGFKNKQYGEDRDYSAGLLGKLNTEVMIEEPIYYYYPSTGV